MSAKQGQHPLSTKATNRLNKLPEMHFKFPFKLIGKSTMTFLTGQSWHLLKSWYRNGGPEQGFQGCFADRLNQKFRSVWGAG